MTEANSEEEEEAGRDRELCCSAAAENPLHSFSSPLARPGGCFKT